MQAAERRSPWIARGQLFDGAVDLAPNALDPWGHAELCDRAGRGEDHQRSTPNAELTAHVRAIEHESEQRDRDTGHEHHWKDSADQRAGK